MLKSKRGHVCEQEQLASDLDRALSLSQLGSLAASHKLTSKSDKSKVKSGESRMKERSIHPSAKAGKHKMATKVSSSDSALKVKGQKKTTTTLFSHVRSELSSCSNSEYLENRDLK